MSLVGFISRWQAKKFILQFNRWRKCHTWSRELRRRPGRLGSIRWHNEKNLDHVLHWDLRFKKVMQARRLIEHQEENILSFRDLTTIAPRSGKNFRTHFRDLVDKYPGIFHVFKDKDGETWVEFTEEAEKLIEEEKSYIASQDEAMAVDKLRKLLMLSVDHRLRLSKFVFAKRDFNLPWNMETEMICRNPQYSRIVNNNGIEFIELVEWDEALAVTAREKWVEQQKGRASEIEFAMIHELFGLHKDRVLEAIKEFQTLPFISPYNNQTKIFSSSPEAKKRAVAMFHELLSLSLQKRMVVNRIAFFMHEFDLPGHAEEFLKQYPGIFYVSHKDQKHTAFLKEAFNGPVLLEKHPLLLIKDKFLSLMLKRHGKD